MILACNHINKSFVTDVILDDITFHIEEKEKVALIGVNGSGKTTLFKIIANELEPDSGNIVKSKDCSIGYLPQHVTIESDKTVYEELLTVFNHIIELENQLYTLEEQISSSKGDTLNELVKQYDNLRETFEQNQGYIYKSLLRGVLSGLGLDQDVYNKPISVLSGGQKTRVALAKLLLQNPNILLLDEPTNHLDIEAIEWLEGFLKAYDGAVLIISHDRYFLDSIVNKVVEIEHGRANSYQGNYTTYIRHKQARMEIEYRHYVNQQREINRQQQAIDKLRQFNREKSIKRAKSKEKQLAKLDAIEKPLDIPSSMKLKLSPQIQSGLEVLKAKDISKSFGDKTLFQTLNFQIRRGDKVALVGPNGIGKTTLFRIIMNQIEPSSGDIILGSNVFIGYYDQEHQNLDQSLSIIDDLQNSFPDAKIGHLRNVLASFLFTGEDVFKPISALSGGEKGRVALAKIILSKANFLLLDEPTNHLDIQSKEILEEALSNYEGTVLYISHDRYFINQTANKVFDMSEYGVTEYLGNYDYFISKKLENSAPDIEEVKETTTTKEDWLESKKIQANLRKLENQLKDIETQIHNVENKIDFIDNQLCIESVYTDPQKSEEFLKEKTSLETSLETLYKDWESLSLSLEDS